MDLKNQFSVFFLCIAIGFLGGIIYEIFVIFRFLFGCNHGKNKILGAIFDFGFFICFAGCCIFFSYLLCFSGFRVYMWLGFGLGCVLYSKTLRRILAFLENMCYTLLHKVVSKAKNKKKLSIVGDKTYDTR